MQEPSQGSNSNQEQLRLLWVFHLIVIGLTLLTSCTFLGWTAIGIARIERSHQKLDEMMDRIEQSTEDDRGEKRKDWQRNVIEDDRHRQFTKDLRQQTQQARGYVFGRMLFRAFMQFCFFAFLVANLGYGTWCLQNRTNHLHLCVSSAITCLIFPFGTALGVITLVLILRKDISDLFTGPKFDSSKYGI